MKNLKRTALAAMFALQVSPLVIASSTSIGDINDTLNVTMDLSSVGAPYTCEVTNMPEINLEGITEVGSYVETQLFEFNCQSDLPIKMEVVFEESPDSNVISSSFAFVATDEYEIYVGFNEDEYPSDFKAFQYSTTGANCNGNGSPRETHDAVGINIHIFGTRPSGTTKSTCLRTEQAVIPTSYSIPITFEAKIFGGLDEIVSHVVPLTLKTEMPL